GSNPVEPQCRLSLRTRRHDSYSLVRLLVVAAVPAEFLRVVNPAAVGRVHLVVHSIADSHRHPVFDSDAAGPAIARSLPAFVILQARIDVVRSLHIDTQSVNLTALDGEQMLTRPPSIEG